MKVMSIALLTILSLLAVTRTNALASAMVAVPTPKAQTQPVPPPATIPAPPPTRTPAPQPSTKPTPPPAPITPPVAAKAKPVTPCKQPDTINHDAKLITPQSEAAWPRSRMEAKREQEPCDAHKPPQDWLRHSLYSGVTQSEGTRRVNQQTGATS